MSIYGPYTMNIWASATLPVPKDKRTHKENKYDINLLARKAKVDLSKDFFNKVKQLNNINIKINS